jgi:hypothetical protein
MDIATDAFRLALLRTEQRERLMTKACRRKVMIEAEEGPRFAQ